MLHIGKWQILRPRLSATICLVVTTFAMVILPGLVHSAALGIRFYCVVFVNHWGVAIGLPGYVETSRVRPHPRLPAWGLVLGVLLLGGVGFIWSAPAWVWRARGYAIPAYAPDYYLISHVVPVVLSVRYGLSFMHFLYDRNIWKMGDPEVRAILGPAFANRQTSDRVD